MLFKPLVRLTQCDMKQHVTDPRASANRKPVLSFVLLLCIITLFAKNLHCDEVHRVVLSRANQYTDQLERGQFTREGTSGPGTGQFMGKGYEFAKGDCRALDQQWLSKKGWKADILGCGGIVLNSDWCARYRSDHQVKYTLHFISWTIGPEGEKQRCKGHCANNKHTVYERIKSN